MDRIDLIERLRKARAARIAYTLRVVRQMLLAGDDVIIVTSRPIPTMHINTDVREQ